MRTVVCNPDNIGDFVIRQPLLTALLRSGGATALAVRDFVAPLASSLFPGTPVFVIPGNPYVPGYHLGGPDGIEFLAALRTFAPDRFITASYQHTHFEEHLSVNFPDAEWVGFNGPLHQPRPNRISIPQIPFQLRVPVDPELPEAEKCSRLAAAVLGEELPALRPEISPTPEGLDEAEAHLQREGLDAVPFWAVCAGDAPEKRIRNWESSQWAALLSRLLDRLPVRLLFLGTPAEHAATAEILAGLGPYRALAVDLTQHPIGIQGMIGLLARAEGYIGRDTGPMHLSAALGKPVLAVFGGGHWPRFVPQATTGAVFTIQVPCRGCDWDCLLPQSLCVKSIPVEPVLESATQLLAGDRPSFQSHVLQMSPAGEEELRRALVSRHQEVRAELHRERGRNAHLEEQLHGAESEKNFWSAAFANSTAGAAARRAEAERRERIRTAALKRMAELRRLAAESRSEAEALRSSEQQLREQLAAQDQRFEQLLAEIHAAFALVPEIRDELAALREELAAPGNESGARIRLLRRILGAGSR